MSPAVRIMRKLAQNNRLANHRLHAACARLAPGEFEATRTSFFPTIKATLSHILTVDWFYVDALEGGTLGPKAWDPEEPFDELAPLTAAQVAVDERLLAFAGTLTEARLIAETRVHRTGRIQVERTDDLLLHLFMHQTHHRGQVHAMLSGSSVPPPQLDEFITASDFRDRIDDMAALGWSEADLSR
ncbi:DinB family protein [Devosia sp. CN2-171]|uniref:DinB family protein n=1 Tax=Devosia sp. CN2-171 TaxID=3400909 RepID=UPI003BF8DCD3